MIGLLLILLLIVVLLSFRIFYENHTFVMRYYEVEKKMGSQDEGGWKIVFLSDLHNKEYGSGNQRLLDAIRREAPDLILVGGDMLIRSTGEKSEHAAAFLERLPDIAPVYCANGNHEQKMKECEETYGEAYRKYRKRLANSGIHMLENEADTIWIRGQRMQIGGLEIPVSFSPNSFPGNTMKHIGRRVRRNRCRDSLIFGRFQREARTKSCWLIRHFMRKRTQDGGWTLYYAGIFTEASCGFRGLAA